MAIVINGSSNTISGVAVGGLPDGIVDTDMLASDAVHSVKIADDAVNGNKVSNDLTIANDLSVTNDLKINSGYGSIQKAYGVRVWCKINSSHTIMGSGGITSVTDNGTGDTTATFTNNMANAHFAGAGLPGGDNTYGTSAQATSSHRTVIHRGDNISDNDSGNYSMITVGELA